MMMSWKVRQRFERVRKAAASTRRLLKEELMNNNGAGMTKHGYEQEKEQEGTKTAAERGVCPRCGSPVSGSPPACPKCGSEPFEKREKR